jgi:hypothetical protein
MDRWANELGSDKVFDMSDLEIAQDMIFFALCCVKSRCPDPYIRQYATLQLMDRFWNEQKSRSIMTE